MIQSKHPSEVTVIEVTDPGTIARHRKQDERHRRNLQWLQTHWSDLPQSRGRYVAVADEEAFLAETSEAAWDWARTQHPNDDGAIVMFVPREKTWRIWMFIRTERRFFMQSFSADGGLTWSPAEPTPIAAVSAPGHTARLHDGRIVLEHTPGELWGGFFSVPRGFNQAKAKLMKIAADAVAPTR